MNERGEYFPLWGTCLGFELLTYVALGGIEHRAHCSSSNQALPLSFKHDFRTSRMFRNAPERIVKILKTEDVTSNFHQYCTTEKVKNVNLPRRWQFWTNEIVEFNGLQPESWVASDVNQQRLERFKFHFYNRASIVSVLWRSISSREEYLRMGSKQEHYAYTKCDSCSSIFCGLLRERSKEERE